MIDSDIILGSIQYLYSKFLGYTTIDIKEKGG